MLYYLIKLLNNLIKIHHHRLQHPIRFLMLFLRFLDHIMHKCIQSFEKVNLIGCDIQSTGTGLFYYSRSFHPNIFFLLNLDRSHSTRRFGAIWGELFKIGNIWRCKLPSHNPRVPTRGTPTQLIRRGAPCGYPRSTLLLVSIFWCKM